MNDTETFLEHFGVRGMHWGVRRSSGGSNVPKTRAGRTTYQKTPHRLSDAELNKRIKRLELEKKYNDLNAAPVSAGRQYTRSLLENSGRSVASAIVGGTAAYFVQRELKRRFPAAAQEAGSQAGRVVFSRVLNSR
jgi:hypothetical protein